MPKALQVILRTLVALGLCALSFVIGRHGGHQPQGAETGEYVAIAAALLALTVWAWREAPDAHGAAEFTANLIRHGLTLTGAALGAILCLSAALIGAWMQRG